MSLHICQKTAKVGKLPVRIWEYRPPFYWCTRPRERLGKPR
jgi:hypothetical protein